MQSVVRTDRLEMAPMAPGDIDELWPMLSDSRMWQHQPQARPGTLARAASYVDRAAARWGRDGLSYWTVRLAESDEVVGSGGAQLHPRGHWNLNYRIAVAHQTQGFAGEVLAAALSAAAEVDARRPCIAWIDDTNVASQRVAVRAGLVNRGSRSGAADDIDRLAYADRLLDDDVYPPAGGGDQQVGRNL